MAANANAFLCLVLLLNGAQAACSYLLVGDITPERARVNALQQHAHRASHSTPLYSLSHTFPAPPSGNIAQPRTKKMKRDARAKMQAASRLDAIADVGNVGDLLRLGDFRGAYDKNGRGSGSAGGGKGGRAVGGALGMAVGSVGGGGGGARKQKKGRR
jgi:hypothetical protein